MWQYIIGETCLRIECGTFPLVEDDFIRRFKADEIDRGRVGKVVYTMLPGKLDWVDQYPTVFQDAGFELHDTPKGMVWICHWATSRFAYGFFLRELLEADTLHCFYDPDFPPDYPLSATRLLSTTGLHSKLLRRESIVLHGAYLERDGAAVVFAGSSGIGKSTQAALWEQAGRGSICNGDRVLLRRNGECWYAYGYPCCGSSRICENRTLPLKAIVLLEQGKENAICPMGQGAKVRRLLLGTQVLSWQKEETDRCFRLVSALVEQAPVLCLSARPDVQAVQLLDAALDRL